jgi:hypothetical protein
MRTSNRFFIPTLIITVLILIAALPGPRSLASQSQSLALDTLEGLDVRPLSNRGVDPVKVTADVATYRGRRAVHMINDDRGIVKGNRSGGESLAIVKGSMFKDGTIEVDLVGIPRPGSPPDTRGFIGIAFHVQENGSRFEAFYLRFTGSQQPCLVVNDLKLGESQGQVALWNGSDTEAYFSRLKISQ